SCELLEDTYENRFDIAYVVSGDSDLTMPVSKVVARSKPVIIANPPARKSQALIRAASSNFSINIRRLRSCILPVQFNTENGRYKMPEKWQPEIS
ncbi:MAG: NYN domain-containing protein, partial [Gammaproteobacteria bacterium]|nr:NYN domain-containing protein [Gammaproteobacteria bacterium]